MPAYLNYFPEDEAQFEADLESFIQHFKMDRSRLESAVDEATGESMMSILKENLILSPEAKRFVILSLLHSAVPPIDPYANTLALVGIPYGVYRLAWMLPFINLPLLGLSVIAGYAAALPFISYLEKTIQRFGYFAVFNYELEKVEDSENAEKNITSGKESLIGRVLSKEQKEEQKAKKREEYRVAGQEYLQKLGRLREIVNKYGSQDRSLPINILSPINLQRKRITHQFSRIYGLEERKQDVDYFASGGTTMLDFYW